MKTIIEIQTDAKAGKVENVNFQGRKVDLANAYMQLSLESLNNGVFTPEELTDFTEQVVRAYSAANSVPEGPVQ